jgi:hypothetical protein
MASSPDTIKVKYRKELDLGFKFIVIPLILGGI